MRTRRAASRVASSRLLRTLLCALTSAALAACSAGDGGGVEPGGDAGRGGDGASGGDVRNPLDLLDGGGGGGGGGDDAGEVLPDALVPPVDAGSGGGDGGPRPPESCDTPFDDDDDGVANESCTCMPGTTQPCFERPEDAFRGMCRLGQQRCEGTGEIGTWGACERSWLPLPGHGNECEVHEPVMSNTATRAPVDIIWFLDTSGSMDVETRYVNANLNTFARTLEMSGLDYRVVMVARRGTGTLQVCVPAPLGGASCADGPRLRHINQTVGSNDGLSRLVSTYPMWRDFTRAGAVKFFVAVTDDESSMSADMFDRTVRAWPGFSSYVFHSIVGYESRTDCPTLARRGGVYLTLTDRTMGERARVCAEDWGAIFTAFARSIVSRTSTWVLGSPARADTVQVWIVAPDGTRTQLTTGWSYDAAMNRVTIAPASLPPATHRVEIVYRPRDASP